RARDGQCRIATGKRRVEEIGQRRLGRIGDGWKLGGQQLIDRPRVEPKGLGKLLLDRRGHETRPEKWKEALEQAREAIVRRAIRVEHPRRVRRREKRIFGWRYVGGGCCVD